MQFKSYKVNPKHRASKPSSVASVWTVSDWIEIQLFGEASLNEWRSQDKKYLWAIYYDKGALIKIGADPENDLFLAKFRCDANLEWHGYPVLPRNEDIPPEQVLESWRLAEKIDKTDKSRIQRGQFKK